MRESINQISDDLIYISHSIIDGVYHIRVKAKKECKICPRCGEKSTTLHTNYNREINDLPIEDKKSYLRIRNLQNKI